MKNNNIETVASASGTRESFEFLNDNKCSGKPMAKKCNVEADYVISNSDIHALSGTMLEGSIHRVLFIANDGLEKYVVLRSRIGGHLNRVRVPVFESGFSKCNKNGDII